MEILLFAVAGAIAGGLASRFLRGYGFGLVGDVLAGAIGGLAGGYLFRTVGAEIGGGLAGSLMVAFAGAVLVLFLVRLVAGRRGGRNVWS